MLVLGKKINRKEHIVKEIKYLNEIKLESQTQIYQCEIEELYANEYRF